MSFDFLGTFNSTQFERFIDFARSQLPLIEARIKHLDLDIVRIGGLSFTFDSNNVPTAVTASPSDSYLGKLLAAYEVLGGNPFFDLRTRNKTQALFVLAGSESNPATTMSNGEPLPTRGLRDAFSAELMRSLRKPLYDTLDRRFERLERKIRRALDYADQLQDEINDLRVLQSAGTLEGSLEYVANQIEQLFGNTNYRAIYADAGGDPLGINTYAPFSQYDVAPNKDPAAGGPQREVFRPQRQGTGFVGPGSKGSSTV
jgi:hypothetical protein